MSRPVWNYGFSLRAGTTAPQRIDGPSKCLRRASLRQLVPAEKIVSPRPPSISDGFWKVLLLTVGLGSVRADLPDSSIKERISNLADLEKSNHRDIEPSRGDSA